MVMSSRFCLSFDGLASAAFVHRSLKPSQITENIYFSVEYWQPFIDQKGNTTATVCGPLLGILIELANQINANLTFIADLSDTFLPFSAIENGTVQIVLTPFAPMSLHDPQVQRLIRFSGVLGDLPMISILSGKQPFTLDFEAIAIFNYAFFYWFFLFFFLINLLSMLLCWLNLSITCNILPNSFRILLRQPIIQKIPFNVSHLLLMNLFLLIGFFHLIFSTKLISFFTFATPYQKIDTLEQLLQEKNMEIVMFEGESSVQLFDDEQYAKYKWRTSIQNPSNDQSGQWEDDISRQINQRRVALISDFNYLNHIFNNHAHKYTNLYRSKSDRLVLPYFLPLSYRNTEQFNAALNILIVKLRQSGLYEYWLRETVLANNPTKKLGFYTDPNKQTFDYARLTLKDCRLIFYLLLLLTCTAILVFVAEMTYPKITIQPRWWVML